MLEVQPIRHTDDSTATSHVADALDHILAQADTRCQCSAPTHDDGDSDLYAILESSGGSEASMPRQH